MLRRLSVSFALLFSLSLSAAQDPTTGLRPGESIRFELRHFMLFGGTGALFRTTKSRNLFFKFEYCVWKPKDRYAAEFTKIQCNLIRRTKYWNVSVQNSVSLSPLSKMVSTLDFKNGPTFSFSDLELENQKRALNPNGEFPSGLRVKLCNDGIWNSTLGFNTLMLPVRGGAHWPMRIGFGSALEFNFKSFSVDGTDAKSLLFVEVLDDKGKPAPIK